MKGALRNTVSYLFRYVEREIWMVECFSDGGALRWIKRKESLDKIKEMSIDGVRWRDHILMVTFLVSDSDTIKWR